MADDSPVEVHTAAIPHDPDWLFTEGRGGALFHTSDRTLPAQVTLEVWAHEPQHTTNDTQNEHRFHTPHGRLMIACITASPSDKNVTLPTAGDYTLRAQRTDTTNIAEHGDPDIYQES